MADQMKDSNKYDFYRISGVTYAKHTDLGPKAQRAIAENSPGRFIDLLAGKITDFNSTPKININK